MKNFIISGQHPLLSLAEISVFFKVDVCQPSFFVFSSPEVINIDFIKSLGGAVKIGEVFSTVYSLEEVKKTIYEEIIKNNVGNKNIFALSFYNFPGKTLARNRKIGLQIKKDLREKNISARVLWGEENKLSSATVENNSLLRKGVEFIIMKNGEEFLLGKTKAVQAFKELSFRDFGRPRRDDQSGMLPPKLAQIMINLSLAKKEDLVLDPFCGSGTIPSELALMGYQKIVASDISNKAVLDSQENLRWLKENFSLKTEPRFFNLPAQEISKKLKNVGAIITEPYLGPQKGGVDYNQTRVELNKLYSECLKEFKKIIGGRLVMVWPFMLSGKERFSLSPDISGYKIVNPFEIELWEKIKKTSFNIPQDFEARPTLIYKREGQRVGREIIILEKA